MTPSVIVRDMLAGGTIIILVRDGILRTAYRRLKHPYPQKPHPEKWKLYTYSSQRTFGQGL
jgi:hypothetical protein